MVGRIRAGGGCLRVAGPSKIPSKGVEGKERRETKIWGKLGQRVGTFIRGVGSPSQTMTWYPTNSGATICRYSTKILRYSGGVLKNFTGIFLWILRNLSKSGNKIWSVNRIWEIFFFESHDKNEVRGLVSDLSAL